MAGVNLDDYGAKLRDEVEVLVRKVREGIGSGRPWDEKTFKEMAVKAHELHKLVNPKHHGYMVKNRGVDPDSVEFYEHVHPVEDLLAYIEDTTANDDPEDQTVGSEFTFRVFTRRWGHEDEYRLKRTAKGWYFAHNAYRGDCDKSGRPFLLKSLDHDFVSYPHDLPSHLSSLWENASEQGLSKEEVQQALQQLGDWISTCEMSKPGPEWKGYR